MKTAAETLPSRTVVLLGIGHTNAHIVRMWRMDSPDDTRLVCISDHAVATYSGMLPACLAGDIAEEEMQIDLIPFCRSAGALLITDPVSSVDPVRRLIRFEQRPSIRYDILSIGVGSATALPKELVGLWQAVAVKPMQTFLSRLRQAWNAARNAAGSSGRRLQIVVVGGGAAGVEITLCLPPFLKNPDDSADPQISLVNGSDTILPGASAGLRRRVSNELRRRGVTLHTGAAVVAAESDTTAGNRLEGPATLHLANGDSIEADLVIVATGPAPHDSLKSFELPLSEGGYLRITDTLQCIGPQAAGRVFAVGDCADSDFRPFPKAGVYAVRQGPVLWQNIRNLAADRPLVRFRPQQGFLKLLNAGNGSAFGEWKGISFAGRWVHRLKMRIDGRFMQMHSAKPFMTPVETQMLCSGCGCKLRSDSLRAGLAGAVPEDTPLRFEDAAVVSESAPDSGAVTLASVDFFSAPLPDPWLSGRIAAVHAASDLLAMGAQPESALAVIVVPEGDAAAGRAWFSEVTAGAAKEFSQMGCRIVGGHTILGPRAEIGFTVTGSVDRSRLMSKGGIRPGDLLYLTKPLGTGILLAAYHRLRCSAEAYSHLCQTMLQPSTGFRDAALASGIRTATDVTGFGLIGHAREMLTDCRVHLRFRRDSIQMLAHAVEAAETGIRASLFESNRQAAGEVLWTDTDPDHARSSLLFDPQTCGGLLLAVTAEQHDRFRAECGRRGLFIGGPVAVAEPPRTEQSTIEISQAPVADLSLPEYMQRPRCSYPKDE